MLISNMAKKKSAILNCALHYQGNCRQIDFEKYTGDPKKHNFLNTIKCVSCSHNSSGQVNG